MPVLKTPKLLKWIQSEKLGEVNVKIGQVNVKVLILIGLNNGIRIRINNFYGNRIKDEWLL